MGLGGRGGFQYFFFIEVVLASTSCVYISTKEGLSCARNASHMTDTIHVRKSPRKVDVVLVELLVQELDVVTLAAAGMTCKVLITRCWRNMNSINYGIRFYFLSCCSLEACGPLMYFFIASNVASFVLNFDILSFRIVLTLIGSHFCWL